MTLVSVMYCCWIATVAANIGLVWLLVARGLYVRYSWLTVNCILSVLADAFFAFIRVYYPHLHGPNRTAVLFLFLFFDGMIVAEAYRQRKKGIQIGMECFIAFRIATMLVQKAGYLWAAYYLDDGTRIYNLILFACFILMLKGEPLYE